MVISSRPQQTSSYLRISAFTQVCIEICVSENNGVRIVLPGARGRKMAATQNVQFALAAYGFREFSLEEYFRAAVDLGLSAVEIDCGWLPQARNKISVEPTEEEIAEVKRLEGEMGVKVVALGGGAVCGVDMVPYREIGVTFDPANFYGFNPDFEGVDPYQALLYFKDRVVYTHWKDFVRTDQGPEYRKVGEGGIDWPPIVKALLESFDGYWAIEYEMGLGCGMEVLLDGSRTGVRNLGSVIDSVRTRAH